MDTEGKMEVSASRALVDMPTSPTCKVHLRSYAELAQPASTVHPLRAPISFPHSQLLGKTNQCEVRDRSSRDIPSLPLSPLRPAKAPPIRAHVDSKLSGKLQIARSRGKLCLISSSPKNLILRLVLGDTRHSLDPFLSVT